MTRLVISVARPATVVVVAKILEEILESRQHAVTRDIFGLRRDIPYVAGVLADSMLPITRHDFWELHSLLEARQFFVDRLNGPRSAFEAKHGADQLLLLLSNRPTKIRWGGIPKDEIEELQQIGSTLYGVAAELSAEPEKEDLIAMSLDFYPWVEVLSDLNRSRPLITV